MVRKLLRSVNRKLSDLDIQRKVILLYLLCALILLTIADCLVVGLVVTNARKSQTELLKNTAQSVEYILNSHVEDACALARSIFLNRRINQFLDTRFSSDLDYYVQRTELLDTFLQEAFLGTSSAVVTIYSDNETMLNGGVFWNLSCPEARKWLPELTSDQGQQLLMYFDDTKTRNFREERKISVVWELDYFSSQETISYVKIDLDYEKLLQELSVTTFGCEVYVCDGAGRILLASDGSAGRSEDFSHISPADLGADAYIRQIRLVEEPLTVYVVPYGGNFLDPVPAQTTALMALMIAITAALLLILRWTVRKNVVDRLSVVTDSFHIDSEGTLRQIPEDAVEGCDEIATLMRDYNAMANRQNRLVETVYKSRLKQQEANIARQEAELLALHSQINLHFLFNVLENIRMRSVVKKEMETAEMIELLAMMERQYVDWSTDMLTIREEKAFVEAYLRLQKYRLGNKLSYAIDMEDHRCDGLKIPKLSILTFVENACVHGAENKAGQCLIFVRAYLEGEDLVIVIEDTGGGMPEDAVRELREKMENASIDMLKGKGRVGIVNACLRLKMQSQGHVRFSLESEEGVGTMIVITSPAGYYDMEGK